MSSSDTEQTEEAAVADDSTQEPDLSDAAEAALDGGDGMDDMPVQETILPAHKIQFTGMGMKGIEDVPAMDEERTFLVRATCRSLTQRRMKTTQDIQHVATMEITEVKDYDNG